LGVNAHVFAMLSFAMNHFGLLAEVSYSPDDKEWTAEGQGSLNGRIQLLSNDVNPVLWVENHLVIFLRN
jgi:hypothetical protein